MVGPGNRAENSPDCSLECDSTGTNARICKKPRKRLKIQKYKSLDPSKYLYWPVLTNAIMFMSCKNEEYPEHV